MTRHSKTAGTKAAQFAEITKDLFRRNHLIRAMRCLKIAEDLFTKGTEETRLAITNTYLYSVSLFLDLHHFQTTALLPAGLRQEYRTQVNSSGT